jgi:sugar phosphate isomerase/epimerase
VAPAGVGREVFTIDEPRRVPNEVNAQLRARFDIDADTCFEICGRLGLVSMLAVAGHEVGAVPYPRLVDGFGALCDRAAAAGIRVDVEFMPFWACQIWKMPGPSCVTPIEPIRA